MKQIIIVEASPRGHESASKKITDRLRKKIEAQYPSSKIIVHDLANEDLPSLDGVTLNALATNISQSTETGKLSDFLTEELLATDLVVISTPMWNFGLPPTVKAWFDLVLRAGKTFQYTPTGAEGLAKGKSAILVISSGGVFTDGPWKAWDFVEPYLKLLFKFIGIENVQTVRVEGLNIPDLRAYSIPNAENAVDKLTI